MISVRFKAIQGYYGLKIVILFFILWYISLYLTRDIRNNYIAVGIPTLICLGICKMLSYYIFSSYYEFSYAKNILIIKKGNDIWKQIPIQDINKIRFSKELIYYASSLIIYINNDKLALGMGGIATGKKDSMKARHLITKRLKPILLENDFQEKITEKEKKIIFEYVKK